MKILCTADWHLGKKLEGYSRFSEQEAVLEEICTLAEKQKPDAVLIAGDCFDTSTPPPESARLFVRSLARLSRGGECPVIVIAGNHDSPSYLSSTEAFASQVGVAILGRPQDEPLLESSGEGWMCTHLASGMLEISFKRHKKSVRFLLSPYADARRLKKDLGTEGEDKKVWELLKQQWHANINKEAWNVLVAHHFFKPEPIELFTGDMPIEDDGERKISGVGGINAIPLAQFPEGIDYAIFGHIHRAQQLYSSKTKAFYTGSPLVYSLSESGQQKSVLMIDLEKNKEQKILLSSGRDVKRLVLHSIDEAPALLQQEAEHYLELIWAANRYLEGHERRLIESTHSRILRLTSTHSSFELSADVESFHQLSIDEHFSEYFSSKYDGAPPSEGIFLQFSELLTDAPEPELPRKRGFFPLRLRLEGLYSYQQAVDIDFTRLGSAGLFGIFGEVGSGKSSIIEAIVFALYDKTERVNDTKSNTFAKAYNMMNHHTDAMLIEFEFQIEGQDGLEHYKITRTAKRKKKDAEFTARHVFMKQDNEWTPLAEKTNDPKASGEQLLGISYNDFRKTIVLQQRDFMGFLNSSPKDNAETLQRLFGLNRFDLAEKAGKIKKQFADELTKINAHVDALADADEETLQENQERLKQIDQELVDLKKQIVAIRKEAEALLHKKETHAKRENLLQNMLHIQHSIKDARQLLDKQAPQTQEFEINIKETKEQEQIIVEQLNSLILVEGVNVEANLRELQGRIKRAKEASTKVEQIFKQTKTSSAQELQESGIKLKKELDILKVIQPLSSAVSLLKDGEACPLCGSVEHPLPYYGESVDVKKMDDNLLQLRLLYNELTHALEIQDEELQGDTLDNMQLREQDLIKECALAIKQVQQKKELETKREQLRNYAVKVTEDLYQLKIKSAEAQKEWELNQELERQYQQQLAELPKDALDNISMLEQENKDKVTSLENTQSSLLEQKGACETKIKRIQEGLNRKQQLKEKQEKVVQKLDDAEVLCKLFSGLGFVKFIAQKYLERLCYTANKRFTEFTGGQFAFLPPKEQDKFIALADCHNGGAQRDLSTLSGGQSFQAALALSAALAEESGAGHRFFFIDEGFGSLDEANLQSVIDTLEKLANEEGRLIGLISHVSSLKDEINAALFVEQTKNGSQIEIREA